MIGSRMISLRKIRHESMMKRDIYQLKLKVQPVKKLTRNTKEEKGHPSKISMKYIKMMKEMITLVVMILPILKNHKQGQVQIMCMTMITILSVDFLHPLTQVTMFITFLRTRTELLLRNRMFGSTLIELLGNWGSLKLLTVTYQRITMI